MTRGQMLCFVGPYLEKHNLALQALANKGLLVKEQFKGAYSLTDAGFQVMKTSGDRTKTPGDDVADS
jgi:uncharacterized protein YwgA